ncbi:hypothetical protein MASR2M47_20800 [Draconibacterium sp.]
MENKYKIGYTTGVFDLFHIGHLNILEKAKEMCEYLIVGVSTDELVGYKGSKAIIPFNERLEIVRSVKFVDEVVAQENMNKMQAWEAHKFDVMFVGNDWKGSAKWNEYESQFEKVGVTIVYFPYTKSTSSTGLRNALDKITFSTPEHNDLISKTKESAPEDRIEKDFIEKFKLNEYLIKKVGNWNISLRPQQPTIGSLVLSLDRKCESLAQMSREEGAELAMAFSEIEDMLGRILKPDKMNYLALMMVDKQVHFHVIPRYSQKVVFNNKVFVDSDWPFPHTLQALNLRPDEIIDMVRYFRSEN